MFYDFQWKENQIDFFFEFYSAINFVFQETLIHFSTIFYLTEPEEGGELREIFRRIDIFKLCFTLLHKNFSKFFIIDMKISTECLTSFSDGVRIKPTAGKLVMFTSGQENVHWVQEVKTGVRVALTMFWTCDEDYQIEMNVL